MSGDSLNESLIERLKQFSARPYDNIEIIRSVTARLHSQAASQDKLIRGKILERLCRKNTGVLGLILHLLETVKDQLTTCSLAGILRECVSPRIGKNRSPVIRQLIAINASQTLVKLLLQMQVKESNVPEILLQEILWVISQLAQRDPKFSLKARLLGAVKTFHYLLRMHHNNTRLIFPLLLIIKALSRNTYTTTVLLKDGIVPTVEKTLVTMGFSPSPKLKLCLSVLHHLSKNKSCCSRIVKTGLIPLLLRLVERWERYDGKMRIRICNHILVILQNICLSKLGRKTVIGNNGLQIMYKFCITCPEEKCYDPLLTRVCNVINLCLAKKNLPVDSHSSPAVFRLPYAKENTSEANGGSSRETSPDSEDESTEEFPEDDDDGVTQEENLKELPENKSSDYVPRSALREADDLKQYESFFQELKGPCVCSKMKCNSGSREITLKKSCSFDALMGESDLKKKIMEFNLTENTLHFSSAAYTGASQSHNSNCSTRNESKDQCIQGKIFPVDGGGENISESSSTLISQNNLMLKKDVAQTPNGRSLASSREMIKGLTVFENIPNYSTFHYAYSVIASRVNSVLPFVKVAYPDMMGSEGSGKLEPLNIKDRRTCRSKLLNCVERGLHPNQVMNKVVYDLDSWSSVDPSHRLINASEKVLFNMDERHLGSGEPEKRHLIFESRFESGNLRKAIQVGLREYDLILMPDVNSSKHHQWFYFEISGMETDVVYTFNIINCEKQNSQFNYGMKPIMYSVQEAVAGRSGWVRVGTDICYYRNSYQNPAGKYRTYLTTTFSLKFPHANDICYIAYHFPFTYSRLLAHIWKWSCEIDPSKIYFRAESLCMSLNNNETPLITLSAADSEENPLLKREIIFLTARVHPGESNSSWVMHGTLCYLLGDTAAAIKLRNRYVFKIVPMLNTEGVINGCHRCGITDEDLNRRWSHPSQHLHPIIYHTKGLLEYCTKVLKKPPYLFCDYHGHSRRKNVFLYGCCNSESWNEADRSVPDNPVDYLMLPNLMKDLSPAFALSLCSFAVERNRESTARVTVWRQLGIKRSYTMESSYCGCDQGTYMGYHLDILHLKEIGANFCEALACLKEESQWQTELLETNKQGGRCEILSPGSQEDAASDSPDHSDSSEFDDEEYHS
ncbi:cytosolic carboxypeptidase 1-like isoform X1 [Schistocerca piceifrons]|uniref:cytosolic carboxypeptidase 1-like isoform X1 n=1 Tax=Schistocerca piceifrons TaxID=274613 RepID=UPI001F5FE70F|nr:cytosolic carboxypeptidase 1-like isoform X1 [Schistocerca piceifrons]XP_047117832.1 cytosolic carboxypeptidase 1-like isoform X1 [Schistocerca piceifrons]